MKKYDPDLSVNGVGRDEPPATAHSGNPDDSVSCGSDIYEELWADIIGEIANAITSSGLTLDGTSRTQLGSAITLLARAASPYVINVQTIASFTGTDVALTAVDLSQAPFSVPVTASQVFLKCKLDSGGTNNDLNIQIGHKLTTQFEAVQIVDSQGNATDTTFPTLPFDQTTNGTEISYTFTDSGSPASGTTGSILLIGYK